MYKIPIVSRPLVSGKRIFLREDLDVPFSQSNHHISDDTRLRAGLETIRFLRDSAATVIIAGHAGRPEGKDEKFSLRPLVSWFRRELEVSSHSVKEISIGGFPGWEIAEDVFLLENLRFFKEETENDNAFAKKLAHIADVYVNDAFGVCHRENASMVSVPKYLPHFAGFHLKKEAEVLSEILKNPKRPLVFVVGGAKIETKLPLIDEMHDFADYVLVGGKLAAETKTLIQLQHDKKDKIRSALLIAELNENGEDITQASVENFLQIINLAKTVVWNGPVGKTDDGEASMKGSEQIAKGIIKSGAYSVVGGGDTLGFLSRVKLLDKFSFYSTGGGAMLAFFSGERLPGLVALEE